MGSNLRAEPEIRSEKEQLRERLRAVRNARTELKRIDGDGNLFAGTIAQLDDLEAHYAAQVAVLLWVLGET